MNSTVLMFKAASHDERYGAEPRDGPEDKVLSPSPRRKSRSKFPSSDAEKGMEVEGDSVRAQKEESSVV